MAFALMHHDQSITILERKFQIMSDHKCGQVFFHGQDDLSAP